MKKRIGILTFWNVPNYGTFLQAYALQKYVGAMFSDSDVRQIAYLDKIHYRTYYSINNKKYRFSIFNPRLYLNIFFRLINYKKIKSLKEFLCYYTQYIPSTKPLTKKDLHLVYFDYIILGSDIIWDFSIPFFNNDPHLFGNGLNCANIISYAASFGTVKAKDICPEYVLNGLNNLSAIAVRDENSKYLVKNYIQKNARIVCDPTFLWDFMNDNNVPVINENNYIVVYGSSFEPELIKGCINYAKQNNLAVISLNSLDDNFDWCDKNIQQDSLTPFQWLAYFKQADVVFTCTYHGLLFGLIFNKKVVFSPTDFIIDKASSLIDYLELNDVLINLSSFSQKVNWDWNYLQINKKIDSLRKCSIDFLWRCLT